MSRADVEKLIEGYEERIAHLRSGLEMAAEDIDAMRRIGPSRAIPLLLARDMERAAAMDAYRAASLDMN